MKPLKILIGNNTLAMLAGSETYTYTLACELKRLGHDVSCYSPELGIISDQLLSKDIHSFSEISTGIKPFSPYLSEPVSHNYDVIIASHFHIVQYLREKFPRTPIINIIHGMLHTFPDGSWAPEHPAIDCGVNQFVTVSKEVQAFLQQQYGIESTVIFNAVDIKKFSSLKSPHEKPAQFLINTNYSSREDPAVLVVKEAARHFGAKVSAIGMNFIPTFDVSKSIEDADVVFGMGRSVLEGVASGRLGIVHGRWGTGGPITSSTVEEIRQFNFSGRNSKDGRLATAQELIEMIEKNYTPANLEWGKNYTAREHNATFSSEAFLRIAYDLTGQTINAPAQNLAVDPAARPLKKAYEN